MMSSEVAPAADERQRRLFEAPTRLMCAGDLVIVYCSPEMIGHVYLSAQSNERYQNRFGSFAHSDFLGQPFGSRIEARDTAGTARRGGKRRGGGAEEARGWVYALAPTPELWTATLPHRTQVVHQLDACVVAFELGLAPGCVVIESGTGSGAMTGTLARSVAPDGLVHTFEFHEQRAQTARDEFDRNGLDTVVRVEHRDVCTDGFGGRAIAADAVFLDLPEPWLALDAVLESTKPGAAFASYSPCIEQVQRTCEALRARGALAVRTIEVRLKTFDVKNVTLDPVPLANGAGPASVGHPAPKPKNKRLREGCPLTEDQDEHGASSSWCVAKAAASMRGHTAFLTFATLPLRDDDDDDDDDDDYVLLEWNCSK